MVLDGWLLGMVLGFPTDFLRQHVRGAFLLVRWIRKTVGDQEAEIDRSTEREKKD